MCICIIINSFPIDFSFCLGRQSISHPEILHKNTFPKPARINCMQQTNFHTTHMQHCSYRPSHDQASFSPDSYTSNPVSFPESHSLTLSSLYPGAKQRAVAARSLIPEKIQRRGQFSIRRENINRIEHIIRPRWLKMIFLSFFFSRSLVSKGNVGKGGSRACGYRW